jgi:hypothetical protein
MMLLGAAQLLFGILGSGLSACSAITLEEAIEALRRGH